MTFAPHSSIIKMPFERSKGRQGGDYAGLGLPICERRQVMCMNAYEITMIVIASMTLLLKLIEFIFNSTRK